MTADEFIAKKIRTLLKTLLSRLKILGAKEIISFIEKHGHLPNKAIYQKKYLLLSVFVRKPQKEHWLTEIGKKAILNIALVIILSGKSEEQGGDGCGDNFVR